MASGAVLAGAYLSRHGISGMAPLSMPSFVTVAAIFWWKNYVQRAS